VGALTARVVLREGALGKLDVLVREGERVPDGRVHFEFGHVGVVLLAGLFVGLGVADAFVDGDVGYGGLDFFE